jgi:hypothetical protein
MQQEISDFFNYDDLTPTPLLKERGFKLKGATINTIFLPIFSLLPDSYYII